MRDPALLLICYDRPEYLKRTIKSLAGLEGLTDLKVYISQVKTRPLTAFPSSLRLLMAVRGRDEELE